MRFFAYIWIYLANQVRNRTVGTTDGVARENGEQVYRENIHYHICGDIYNVEQVCVHCNRHETVVNFRGIGPQSYVPGERIIEDLEELRWVVVRGMRIDESTYDRTNGVTHMGRGWQGTWHPVQSDGSDRVMKYKHTSTIHR